MQAQHLFQINPNSGEPIYRQIINQVTHLVYSGVLTAGDDLPSVRQLATFFDINPMTISKAYSMLELTGMLERKRGKGMYVSMQHKKAKDLTKRMEMIRPEIKEIIAKSRRLAISDKELLNMIQKLLEDKNG